MPGSSEYDASGGVQDPAAAGPRGPGPHDQIPPNKPPWFDQPHPVAPWGQQQVFSQTCGGGGGWALSCVGRWAFPGLLGKPEILQHGPGAERVGERDQPHVAEGQGQNKASQLFTPIPVTTFRP